MILGQLVRKWRTSHEISRRALADMILVNHCTLKRFEDGEDVSAKFIAAVLSWALGNQPFSQAAFSRTPAGQQPEDTGTADDYLSTGFVTEARRHLDASQDTSACDCRNHQRQVCDICQGVTGNEKDAVPEDAPALLGEAEEI